MHETTMVNLSESGVAFLMDAQAHPKIGEQIKVEVPIPNGEQLAWFGRVVHVREHTPSRWLSRKDSPSLKPRVYVGIRFERLPIGHTRALQKGIEQSFIKAMRDQQYRNFHYYHAVVSQYFPRFLLYALLTAALIGFMYYITLPDEKYDAHRGSHWGERFKF